jgi:hypothetical protein
MVWILLSILVLFTAGLAASVYLLFSLKRQGWESERRTRSVYEELAASLARVQREFEKLSAEFRDLEERTGMLVAPAPAPSGLDLTKRTQAERMLKRGEQPEQVAAALRLPQAETELLDKVIKINASQKL